MAEANLTAQRLRELLSYDESTGQFTRRVSRQGRNCKAGDIAGFARHDGYVKIHIEGESFYAHRLAWFYANGVWPTGDIDHINGNPNDNRLTNLRDVPSIVNSQNIRAAKKRKLGGTLLGAHWSSVWKRWKTSICIRGKSHHIGWFDTEQQAHEAYVEAKRRLHPGCTI